MAQDEEGVEAFYTFKVAKPLRITADVRYIDSTVKARKPGWTVGLRAVTRFWSFQSISGKWPFSTQSRHYAIDSIADIRCTGQHQGMKLESITANRHIFEGHANGKPLRLLLTFEGGKALCLRPDGDGARIIADNSQLDGPLEIGEYGQTDIADVTQTLFPALRGLEVIKVNALILDGRRVGVQLDVASSRPFNFWVDGDELHWGDAAALIHHDWLDGMVPNASGPIVV